MATAKRNSTDTGNEYLGRDGLVMAGDVGAVMGDDIVTEVPFGGVELEQFMNEELTIIVQSTGAENEIPYASPGVNGQTVLIPRDEPTLVKRKFVEALARGKRTLYEQNLDFQAGEKMNAMKARNSLTYPFSILHDPNPRGVGWIREVLAGRR